MVAALVLSCEDIGSNGGACKCNGPNRIVEIDLGCHSGEKPVVKTGGPCSVASGQDYSEGVYLQASGAGTCHAELTFGSGTASSVDVAIVSRWEACGSDPHGCGQAFLGVTDTGDLCLPSVCKISVPDLTCDAGQ
jgi:hypothetical protein